MYMSNDRLEPVRTNTRSDRIGLSYRIGPYFDYYFDFFFFFFFFFDFFFLVVIFNTVLVFLIMYVMLFH